VASVNPAFGTTLALRPKQSRFSAVQNVGSNLAR